MSKLSIIIEKTTEKKGIAFYRVCGSSVNKHFYLGIDRPKQLLYIYLSNDFTKPIRIIDATKDFPIQGQDNIDPHILAPVFARALETLKLDYYPDGISYAA